MTEPPADQRHVGKVVGGRYRIVRRIAVGGMGEVYLALHEELKYKVAVKILSKAGLEDESLVARFLNEARSCCRISHPFAVVVHDFDRLEDGTPFLVMEYIQGVALSTFMKENGVLHPMLVARLGAQLCEVLAAAHRQKIIHRDIKPDNVMVVEGAPGRFSVKMLDFGIAKILDDEMGQGLTQTGMTFGTPEYMSPEQASGELVDARSDVYALGCLLFAMLAGRPPFENRNKLALLNQHVHAQAPSVSEVAEQSIPEALDALIARMLAKDPADRPSAMEEVLTALESVSEGTVGVTTGSAWSASGPLQIEAAQAAPTAAFSLDGTDEQPAVEEDEAYAFGDGEPEERSTGPAWDATEEDWSEGDLLPPLEDEIFVEGASSGDTEYIEIARPARSQGNLFRSGLIVVVTVLLVGGVLWGASAWWMAQGQVETEVASPEPGAPAPAVAGAQDREHTGGEADDSSEERADQPSPDRVDPARLNALQVEVREGHAMLNEARFDALASRIVSLRGSGVPEIVSDAERLEARWSELRAEDERIRVLLEEQNCLAADQAVIAMRETWGGALARRYYGELTACREAQRCRRQGGCPPEGQAPATRPEPAPSPAPRPAPAPEARPSAEPAPSTTRPASAPREDARPLPPRNLFDE